MSEWLTESDWERIISFANASMHERTPELLLPESGAGSDDSSQTETDPVETASDD
ncbi:hypothetical protein [Halocatena salina]|uniref:Uncharacterized protein n=1 Tax=Halocatena salina TaxID=2934340 RepID=A0A8U0A267_9EURY|nr:hypothetical protein [Halocatena salina]UPM42879.1 hypothetical protein MW046_00130 [Halocatena salina]